MTIEQKLDWLLDKARKGELDLGKTNNEKGFVNDQYFMQELYGFHPPGTKEAIASDTEWEQLKDKLFEDELLEEDYMGNYVLSLKGKIFEGYVKAKIRSDAESMRVESLENNQKVYANRMTYLTIILAAGGMIAAIYYGIEIVKFVYSYYHAPR